MALIMAKHMLERTSGKSFVLYINKKYIALGLYRANFWGICVWTSLWIGWQIKRGEKNGQKKKIEIVKNKGVSQKKIIGDFLINNILSLFDFRWIFTGPNTWLCEIIGQRLQLEWKYE